LLHAINYDTDGAIHLFESKNDENNKFIFFKQ